MKPDDQLNDQQSLRDEFDTPPSVHEMVFERIAQRRLNPYREGVTRREYARELADLIRDNPMVEPALRQRCSIRVAMSVAATIAKRKG